jgi:D-tyrosyl-tRNA(Tyr) deacylase
MLKVASMRAVVQRVREASVSVKGQIIGSIGKGLLIFLGISEEDTQDDAQYLARKIPTLRIFEGEDRKMNLSLEDMNGKILVVSQFTLVGDCRKGRRPSFDHAAGPEVAQPLYEYFLSQLRERKIQVATGRFQEYMAVYLINDGPVTFILDSKGAF